MLRTLNKGKKRIKKNKPWFLIHKLKKPTLTNVTYAGLHVILIKAEGLLA